MVDGRILLRAGKFAALVQEQIIAGAAAALVSVEQRVKKAGS
jgi:hypothetical protein